MTSSPSSLDPATHSATESELAERLRAYADSEALSAAVVASALDCIIVIDEAGCVIEFNPAAERVFGYERATVLGRPIGDLIVPPGSRTAHEKGLERYRATGVATVLGRRIEIDAMRADGTLLPVELAITEVRLPARRLFTAHVRDLTEAHRTRAELERQREALHQSEKLAALGSLLAGVAHELNNPLSIVTGQALMLREAANGAARQGAIFKEFAERSAKIEAAADRCARIVKTFLAMARQRQAERRTVRVPALVEGVLDLLTYGLRTAGIEIVVDLAADLPAIRADADQIQQVLVNLIVNAKQALEEMQGPRRIMIRAVTEGEPAQIVFTVADNGPGVTADIRGRIFDPFFTTKPQGTGTGIGLAVSRGLVEAHGGTLILAPPDGRGATFVMRLPVEMGGAEASQAADAGSAVGAKPTPSRRALVIDDEVEIVGLLSEILRRQGFACDVATGGSVAKSQIEDQGADYDVILCDIRMPDGDGPSLFDWVVSEYPQLARRMAFVTGDTLGPAAGRFLARSGCPVVEKPFTPADIERVVGMLLTETSEASADTYSI
jgi:PAS domain S-box-containing protein